MKLNMPRLDPQVAMHRLNIKPDTKPVKSNNVGFVWTLWRLLKSKFISSLHMASYGRNSIQIGLLISFPFSRRMGRYGSASTSVISIQLVLKTNSHCPSPMSWLIIPADSKECPSWTAFQDITKLRCIQRMRNILRSEHRWGYTAIPWCPLDL